MYLSTLVCSLGEGVGVQVDIVADTVLLAQEGQAKAIVGHGQILGLWSRLRDSRQGQQ